jgi:hypothetical protein
LKPKNWTKQLESSFLLKIQGKKKTKTWINPPNSKNHKTRFFGGRFFLLQTEENIEILINLSNS